MSELNLPDEAGPTRQRWWRRSPAPRDPESYASSSPEQARVSEPAGVPDAGAEVRAGDGRKIVRGIVVLTLATGLGVFMLGFPAGVLPALATVVFFLAPQETSRAASLAAFVLLAIAAVATLAEGSLDPNDLSLRYSRDRDIATTAAAAAGGLLGVAVFTGAIIERAPEPARPRLRRRLSRPRMSVVGPHLPVAVSLVVGAVIRVMVAPSAFGADGRIALANLASGTAYQRGLEDGVLVPPLAPALALVLPLGDQLLLLVTGLATIVVAVRLADQLTTGAASDRSRRIAWCTGLVAATLPTLVTQRLPEALATLLVVWAATLAWPREVTAPRVLASGTLVGLAFLAEPTALVAAPLLAAWLASARRRDSAAHALLLLVPVVLVIAPLLQWNLAVVGTLWPRSPADAASIAGSLRLLTLVIDGAAGVACLLATSETNRGGRRDGFLLIGIPVSALVLCAFTGASSGLWGWSSGVVAAGAGILLAARLTRGATSLPPPSAREDGVEVLG